MAPHPLHEQNRRSWNHATIAHNSHKGDQAAFLRGGGSTLFPEELELCGDVRGKRLLHLQCNAGQDSLSLASGRVGATVTGVDISDTAIAFARELSADSGIVASFVRADVYDFLDETAAGSFDVAFASYGALIWLSDLPRWGRGVVRALAPGGRLVLVEFHPMLVYFDDHLQPMSGDKLSTDGIYWAEGVHDYVADSGAGLLHGATYQEGLVGFRNPEGCHEFLHTLGNIVDAVASAGLTVERLREYHHANGWKGFKNMVDLGNRRWGLPKTAPPLPLMYGLSARR